MTDRKLVAYIQESNTLSLIQLHFIIVVRKVGRQVSLGRQLASYTGSQVGTRQTVVWWVLCRYCRQVGSQRGTVARYSRYQVVRWVGRQVVREVLQLGRYQVVRWVGREIDFLKRIGMLTDCLGQSLKYRNSITLQGKQVIDISVNIKHWNVRQLRSLFEMIVLTPYYNFCIEFRMQLAYLPPFFLLNSHRNTWLIPKTSKTFSPQFDTNNFGLGKTAIKK